MRGNPAFGGSDHSHIQQTEYSEQFISPICPTLHYPVDMLLRVQEVITQRFQQSRMTLRGNCTDCPDDVLARDYR